MWYNYIFGIFEKLDGSIEVRNQFYLEDFGGFIREEIIEVGREVFGRYWRVFCFEELVLVTVKSIKRQDFLKKGKQYRVDFSKWCWLGVVLVGRVLKFVGIGSYRKILIKEVLLLNLDFRKIFLDRKKDG